MFQNDITKRHKVEKTESRSKTNQLVIHSFSCETLIELSL